VTGWRAGLLLALSTAVLWATLPIAAKLALQGVDPFTLTWVRFAVAGAFTVAYLGWRGGLGVYRTLGWRTWAWLALAALTLVGNYLLYLVGLELTTPANAQVLIQAAPLLMGLGGLVFFRERFRPVQWLGLAVLLTGMGLFFSDQLIALVQQADTYVWGALTILAAAVSWAAYALVQKKVGGVIKGQGVLLFVYVVGTLLLFPTSTPSALAGLSVGATVAVVYCCLNTVLAYGAFAASVEVWESARVSAVLTLTPLGTLFFVQLITWLGLGWVRPEAVSGMGWAGAVMVVAGSMTISLAGVRRGRLRPARTAP
jgi:drug/metabolite transporter (DMT)-like permease